MYTVYSSIDTDEPIMLLNQVIGYNSEGSYIDGGQFQSELMELDNLGKKRIVLHINSVGGNVVEGYSICSAILKSKTPVDTYNVGIAASMAGAIFMCGRKRIMMDYATLMIHNPFSKSENPDKKQLQALRESLVTMIAAKTSLTKEDVAYLCDRETWIGASECFEKGFCTDIETTAKSNQKNLPIQAGIRAMWAEANLIHNNILNNTTMETVIGKSTGLGLIANYLDLNVEASENAVFSEVKRRLNISANAVSTAEDAIAAMKKKMGEAEAEFKALKDKYDALVTAQAKAEKDTIDAKAKADAEAKVIADNAAAALKKAEDDGKLVAIKAMIGGFVGKRIKADAVTEWETTALAVGIDKAKALIEGLPLNATAVSTTVSKDGVADPTKEAASSMSYMAKIQADLRDKKKIA